MASMVSILTSLPGVRVAMATPFQFINGKILEKLYNAFNHGLYHTILHHWLLVPLEADTDTQAHISTCKQK